MKPDLSTNIGGIAMKNPVMVASGTFGYGPEYADLVDLNALGAIVVKGICMEATTGNPPPRTVEVASGLINAIGLQNPGVDGFINTYIPFLKQYDVPVIVNIWGRSLEEYADVAERFDAVDEVAGLEVNVSCPNIKEGRGTFGSNLDLFKEVISAIRKKTQKPIIPKLAPDINTITTFAKAAEECGADAVSLINSIPAMAIDIETRTPILGNKTGGLSGPAIRPIAVKMVWETAKMIEIPIIGIGGISSAHDALEFMIAGADAIAVGTANFTDPDTAITVIKGIEDYLTCHKMTTLQPLIGSLEA